MRRCFVIQPFDGGPFDKRFDDVLAPAIEAVGFEPYRVDRDPGVTIPIDSIESGIRDAIACLADITTDNPNVWFELGYAFAQNKPVVLICSSERTSRFPFDVQHRHVITYKTDSPSDFGELRNAISERFAAAISKESQVRSLAQATLKDTEGLEPHEIAALVIIAESDLDPDSPPSAYALKQDMLRAGYTEIATVLAVKSLASKGLIDSTLVQSFNSDDYTGFQLQESGTQWLIANRGSLVLRSGVKPKSTPASQKTDFEDYFPATPAADDDLPF